MKVTECDDVESEDDDVCDHMEISRIFTAKCEEITSNVNKDKHLLHIDGTADSTPNIVVGCSDNTVEIFNLDNGHLSKLHSVEVPENVIGVKSCKENKNLLYIGTKNCEIRILDLRDQQFKQCFKDTTLEAETNYKPLNCFDVALNNLLCGGTDLHAGDAYILFWDIRNTKLLGAYWDSHTDDITEVKFHPSDVNRLISGSTDGLINVYDILQTSEDDALLDTLNTESSIEKLCWYREDNLDMIGSITHTHDLQIWRLEGAAPYAHIHRETIAKELNRKREDCCYIANIGTNKYDKLLALVGSSSAKAECLRGLGVDKKSLTPLFDMKSNEQRVTCSWLNKNGDILVTGGEGGIINIWNVESNFETHFKRKK